VSSPVSALFEPLLASSSLLTPAAEASLAFDSLPLTDESPAISAESAASDTVGLSHPTASFNQIMECLETEEPESKAGNENRNFGSISFSMFSVLALFIGV
jgi:hypothetical protein